jgi:cardiolipin synthase
VEQPAVDSIPWAADALFVLDILIRVGLSIRIITRRLPVGVALAWLSVVMIFPFLGAVLYLLIGESRLGRDRQRQAQALRDSYRGWTKAAAEASRAHVPDLPPCAQGLAHLGDAVLQIPPLAGNELRLLHDAGEAFPALICDIDAARHSCHLEFYIWDVGGKADQVVEALLRAAARGVVCRVLVDAVGSKRFLRSEQTRRLRAGRVDVREALPVTLRRLLFVRADLRLHRKIVVIDGSVAYTGSLNLADPELFKRNAGVGQWVDAFARLRGPAVEALNAIFLYDWELETGESIRGGSAGRGEPVSASGGAVVQVLPSGPGEKVGAIEQVLLAAIYAANRELVMTTPYFVPGESLITALLSAPGRGVDVTLIVPARVDSRMTHFASRAFQADLLAAGVRIALYQGGLLHTKSLTADGQYSLFGSLNLDPRSLRLDFEVTLAVYDAEFTMALRRLQHAYIEKSQWLDLAACRARPAIERFAEDAARLVGPLL